MTDAPLTMYKHHGRVVVVRADMIGKHVDYCLCYGCAKFDPAERNENCPIANAVYDNCVRFGIVSPVWECPDFIDNTFEKLEAIEEIETDED